MSKKLKSRKNKKPKNPTFVHQFLLKVNSFQKRKLKIKFRALRELYNMVLGEIIKREHKLRLDSRYKIALDLYRLEKTKQQGKDLFKILNNEYLLKKENLQSFATQAKNSSYMRDHLDGDTVQVISDRAYDAYMDYRFGLRGKPRFKSYQKGLKSISGKKNNCIFFTKEGKVKWKDLLLDVVYDKKDINGVQSHALSQKIKYCRIVTKFIKGQERYYLQLVLDGNPKQKHSYQNKTIGLDIGPSTIAVVSDNEAILEPLCSELEKVDKEIKKIQRSNSRKIRINNPNNYEKDFYKKGHKKLGKVIKGKKVWIKSTKYIQNENKIKELHRILADKRKNLHNSLANKVLSLGKNVKIENNNYKAWQKGLFGKTIGFRAPSIFVSTLNRKAESAGGYVETIPTWTSKLSQFCHVCENFTKKSLSQRTHTCCGITIQRDLYSALLIKHYDLEAVKVNTKPIRDNWKSFDMILNDAVLTCSNKFRKVGILPTSLGIQELEKRNSHIESLVVSGQCQASNECESMKKKPEEVANKKRTP